MVFGTTFSKQIRKDISKTPGLIPKSMQYRPETALLNSACERVIVPFFSTSNVHPGGPLDPLGSSSVCLLYTALRRRRRFEAYVQDLSSLNGSLLCFWLHTTSSYNYIFIIYVYILFCSSPCAIPEHPHSACHRPALPPRKRHTSPPTLLPRRCVPPFTGCTLSFI
jgi:hypothetical protein